MKNKIIAWICIVCGIAIMAVPFFYHLRGKDRTDKLISQFEQQLEDSGYEENEERVEQEEKTEQKKKISEEDETILSGQNVIGIIKIDSIDIRYPIVEGSDSESIAYAIGHMSETAGIGKKGNCVLCGHNGSRNGTFFINLNQIAIGDNVQILDSAGREHIYKVCETYIVDPDDDTVKSHTDDEILTLLTCANWGTQRFICRCIPVDTGKGG